MKRISRWVWMSAAIFALSFAIAQATHAKCPEGQKKAGTYLTGGDICISEKSLYTVGAAALKKQICDRGPNDGKEGTCCIEDDKGGEQFHLKTETCYDEKNTETKHYYGDCFCVIKGIDDPSIVAGSPMSSKSCRLECEAKGGRPSTNRGIGRRKAQEGKPDESQFVNVLCFTKEECASEQYGGSARAFVPHAICPTGMGKCLAPEPTIELQSGPVLGVTKVQGFRRYVDLMYRFFLSIVVLTAGVMFVYGGFKYILSSAGAEIGSAKETMVNAAIGLVLSLGAVALLRTVNPATLDLTRLDIYLLKKVQYAKFNFCREFKGEAGKVPKFGDAGAAPNFKPFESVKFTITPEQTSCGAKYYVDGLGGKTCDGDVCPTGHACLSCKGAGEIGECAGVTKGFACVKSVFAGNVSWQDKREPKDIYLLPVCNAIQDPKKFDKIDSNVIDKYPATITRKSGDRGDGSYLFAFDQKKLDGWKSDCKGKGELRGFLIGVVYRDPYDVKDAFFNASKQRAAIAGAKKEAIAGAKKAGFLGAVVGGAIGGVAGTIQTNYNDIAVISPANCGKQGLYPGYADGASAFDLPDIKQAIYCGWRIKPGDTFSDLEKYKAEGSTQVFNKLSDGDPTDPYWDTKKVESAIKDGKSITCNIVLDDTNAPSNPSSAYLGCCTKNSTWENADKTNLWCK